VVIGSLSCGVAINGCSEDFDVQLEDKNEHM